MFRRLNSSTIQAAATPPGTHANAAEAELEAVYLAHRAAVTELHQHINRFLLGNPPQKKFGIKTRSWRNLSAVRDWVQALFAGSVPPPSRSFNAQPSLSPGLRASLTARKEELSIKRQEIQRALANGLLSKDQFEALNQIIDATTTLWSKVLSPEMELLAIYPAYPGAVENLQNQTEGFRRRSKLERQATHRRTPQALYLSSLSEWIESLDVELKAGARRRPGLPPPVSDTLAAALRARIEDLGRKRKDLEAAFAKGLISANQKQVLSRIIDQASALWTAILDSAHSGPAETPPLTIRTRSPASSAFHLVHYFEGTLVSWDPASVEATVRLDDGRTATFSANQILSEKALQEVAKTGRVSRDSMVPTDAKPDFVLQERVRFNTAGGYLAPAKRCGKIGFKPEEVRNFDGFLR